MKYRLTCFLCSYPDLPQSVISVWSLLDDLTHLAFSCLKSKIKTLEKGVKHVQIINTSE